MTARLTGWRDRLLRPENRYDPARPASPFALADLLGTTFFADTWSQRPARLDLPGGWLPDGDWLETAARLRETLPAEAALVVDATGRRPATSEDDPRWFGADRLLVLRDVHAAVPALGALHAAFGHTFRCPVTTGLYVNRPGAPGFEMHHDAHHVFAVQLAGEKTWTLAPASVPWPSRRFEHDPGPPTAELPPVRIAAGEVLYLPPGVRHRAASTGEVSVHVTFGVHAPRAHDVLEALLEEAALADTGFRGPLARPTSGGWIADPARLGAGLRWLADRVAARSTTLHEGTPVAVAAWPEVEGQWPVVAGRFAPLPAVPSPTIDLARRAGAALVTGFPELRSVVLRGSALEGDPHAADVDLLLLHTGAPRPEAWAALLADVDPSVRWDARPVAIASLATGSPWVRLCLAARSVTVAGEPVAVPPLGPEPALAEALLAEAAATWRAHLVEAPPPERTPWFQKRALRLVGLRALRRHGVFTRHPNGNVQLAERHLPELAPLARSVRDDLFAGRTDGAALRRAVALGEALLA